MVKKRAMKLAAVLFLTAFCLQSLSAQQDAPAPRNTLASLVRMLAESDDAQFHLDILKGISEGLKGRRTVKMPEGWEPVADKLRSSTNAQVRELSQSLSVTFGSTTALATLRQRLLDPAVSPAGRSNALATLLQIKDAQLVPALQKMLHDPSVRGHALRALAAFDDPKTPETIFSVYGTLSAGEKNVALTTLSSRLPYARALLRAVGEARIPAKDLTADIVRQLGNLNDGEVTQQIAKNWGVTRESGADKEKEIGRLEKLLEKKGFGRASPGRAIYAKVCQQCHALFGEGTHLGPDLTAANRNDTDYLLQNIVAPNALIPNDYRTWNVDTKDDRSITGIVTKQDEKAVTIVTATETLVIPRAEVQSMQQGELSLMPEGLLQSLTEDEIRDLLAYLRSAAQVPLPPDAK